MEELRGNLQNQRWNGEIKKSPFLYRSGLTWKEERGKTSGVLALKKMVISHQIDNMEIMILEGLYKYHYLGGYMLRKYISNQEKKPELERGALRKRLRWMIEKGLVRQFEFFDGLNGSSFIYSLDESGLRFLRMMNGKKVSDELPEMKPEQVLNDLVCNQFLISLQGQYPVKIRDVEVGEESSFFMTLPAGDDVEVYVFAVRDSGHYKKYFLRHLRKIMESKRQDIDVSVFVFCETEYQAMKCAKFKGGDASLANMDVYYMLDTFGVSEDVLGKLIEILPGYDYTEKQMFRLEI